MPLEEDRTARFGMCQKKGTQALEIVVVRLPYLSNYDEFDALAAEPSVRLRFAAHAGRVSRATRSRHPPRHEEHAARSRLALAARPRAAYPATGDRAAAPCSASAAATRCSATRVSDPVGAEAAAGTTEPGLESAARRNRLRASEREDHRADDRADPIIVCSRPLRPSRWITFQCLSDTHGKDHRAPRDTKRRRCIPAYDR